MSRVSVLVALALGGTTACATFANGSAPGKDPSTVYVAGQKAGQAQMWLCPAAPGKGDCKEVEVEEVDR